MTRNRMTRNTARRWLVYFFLVSVSAAVLSLALVASIQSNYESVSIASRVLIVSMFCIVAGIQLLPSCGNTSTTLLENGLIPAFAIVIAALFLQIIGGFVFDLSMQLKVSGALLLLATTVCLLHYRLAKKLNDHRSSIAATQALLATVSLAPVWLGPVAALNSQKQILVDAIVAASPISYLASTMGADYLRGSWFYQYTEIGLQRFNYPDPVTATLVLLLLVVIAWAPAALKNPLNPSQQRFQFLGVNSNHE